MKADKKIKMQGNSLSCILLWINEHPSETFCGTIFQGSHGSFIVSDYMPTEIFLDCEAEGLNEWSASEVIGWQISENVCGSWICRNGSRYVFISE